MAHLQPSAFQGSSCHFCKTAPATVLVNGHLACERHKNSNIVEVGSSAKEAGGSSGTGDKGAGNDGDDDDGVLEVWQPAVAVSPSSPPSKPFANSGIVTDSSSSSGGGGGGGGSGSSSSSTSRTPGSQRSGAASVPASPWGSPAAPLALSDDDDDYDDDVRFAGTSSVSGVVDLTVPLDPAGAATSAVRRATFGGGSSSSSSSSGVHTHRARRRSLPPPPPAGTEIVDLAAAAAFLDPAPARGEPKILDGAGSGGNGGGGSGSGSGSVRHPVFETAPEQKGAAKTASTMTRAQGHDQTRTTTGAGAGAGASAATAKATGEDSSSSAAAAVKAKSAPSANKAGKARPQKKQRKLRPEAPCIVCFEDSVVDRCARCPEGHAMCKPCVNSYVTETLMPQGTIFWDTIKCGGSSSCGYLFGPSVTALLPRITIRKIETKQMDVAHLVAGERDPTSDKWISKHSKDCPNCGVPIQRSSGCMHMTCVVCRHNFWYNCPCKYPGHASGCTRSMY